jgi:NADH dehydrogenase
MATRSVAAVFGGSGFIGRYVVQRLAARGYVVRVVGRDTERAKDLMVTGAVGQVVALYASFANPATIARATEGADLVVNLIGILSERRSGDFQRVHAEGPGAIARAAAGSEVQRMVQISAIGADASSPSLYARTKAAGEAAVHEVFPTATILRPSIVFGAEDKFFNRFGAMAMYLPVMPVICGHTRFQPVYVGDVADAIIASLEREDTPGQTYELGGPRIYTFRELLVWLLHETRRHRALIEIPLGLARLQARLGELAPGKPFTRDQLLMLQRDNVATEGMPGLAELGIVPTPIEAIVPDYLDRYRPGGGKREEVPAEIRPDRP